MRELASRIAGMSQQEAATLLGVTQPRVSELVRGKINFFALDKLVNMAARAGLGVKLTVEKRGSGSSGTENAFQPDAAAAPVTKPTCDYRNNMTCEAASS